MIRNHVQGLLGVALSIVLAGCSEGDAPVPVRQAPDSPANPSDAAQVARGEITYRNHCASCHGTNLEGQAGWQTQLPDGRYPAPPHDGTGHTWRHSDRQLFDGVRLGGELTAGPGVESGMPGFAELLSEDEIWASIAFIKSRWPPELAARQRLTTRKDRSHPRPAPVDHSGHAE